MSPYGEYKIREHFLFICEVYLLQEKRTKKLENMKDYRAHYENEAENCTVTELKREVESWNWGGCGAPPIYEAEVKLMLKS